MCTVYVCMYAYCQLLTHNNGDYNNILSLTHRHKSDKAKVQEVKGKLNICSSHLETTIDKVVIITGVKSTAQEIVREALIKFDLVVSKQQITYFVKWLAFLGTMPASLLQCGVFM